MKTITVKNLTIQFDSHHDIEDLKEYVLSSVELINLALQREPYNLGAQILETGIDKSDIEVEEWGNDESVDEYDDGYSSKSDFETAWADKEGDQED